MKRFLLAFFFLATPLLAQGPATASNPLGGNLTLVDAGTCSTNGSFIWQRLPVNAATTTVNLAGTFNATVTIRESNNGGGTWTTAGTANAVGTSTFSTNGFTDICADVTTFVSGTVNVTISTGLNTGPQGPAGPGGGITSVASANSGLAGAIYPNAAPYNISFDGKACFGTLVSWTTGNPSTVTLDGTVCKFAASEIGTSTKKAFGTNGCCGNLSAVAASAVLPFGTITITSATTASVGSAGTACNTVICEFHWFTDDRAKWCCGAGTVDNAWNTAVNCPTVFLPAGWSPIPVNLFNSPGLLTCSSGTFANVASIWGLTDVGGAIVGQSIGNSGLLIPPDTNLASCNGGTGNVCWFYGAASMQNFTVSGGNNGLTGTNNKTLIGPNAVSSFNNMLTFTGYGSGDLGNLIGFQIPFSNVNNGIYVDQFGSQACGANATNIILTNSFCGDQKGADLTTSGTTVIKTQNVYFGYSQGTCVVINTGTTWYSEQDQNYAACGGGANAGLFIAGVAHIKHHTQSAVANSFFDGIQLAAGGIAFIQDSTFAGATTCIHNSGVSLTTGALFNQGGNTCLAHNIATTIIPTWASTGTGATPCVPTTDTSALAITGNEAGTFTCTAAAGAAATGTFVMTFAGTFSMSGQVPTCTLTLKDGTGAWTLPAMTKETASTTQTYTWAWFNTGALTAASTYKGAWNCVAR